MDYIIKRMYWVLGLVTVSLVGLVVIQYQLIDNSVQLKKEQFDTLARPQLSKLETVIRTSPSLQPNLIAISRGHESHLTDSKESIFEEITQTIDSLLQSAGFDVSYEYGLVLHRSSARMEDSLLFVTSPEHNSQILDSRYRFGINELQSLAHFNVYFPNKDADITAQARKSLFASLLFIALLIGCFVFAFHLIRSQKKVSEIKNDFINNLTHEFKTPIFSISLAVKTLRERTESTANIHKYLEVIRKENNRLKTQVNKILQIALIDSGKFELDKSKIDLHNMIKEVVKRFELILSDKNATINLNLKAKNHFINGDLLHLSNLIYNLIDNSIKYSDINPEIIVKTSNTANGIYLIIRDNGLGMDADTQKYIFDRFYRAHTGNVHDVKGFGLGLSYVKKIVEVHNGHIKLESSPQKGTEFSIVFPY